VTTIGITGADGFFGWHLRCRLKALHPQARIKAANRKTFASEEKLTDFVGGCSVIVHLAGANRGSESAISEQNPKLAQELTDALRVTGSKPHLVFADSTHRERSTAYGASKKRASGILQGWGREVDAPVANLVFPNLFGEHGRPFYNSAVATFCHQISRGEPCEVNPDGTTELLHIQDAAQVVIDAIALEVDGVRPVRGVELKIPDLYRRLVAFRDLYRDSYVPDVSASNLDLQLFNTLRSYLFPTLYPIQLARHSDDRGSFCELARGFNETQVSVSTTRAGITRGNHFHLNKLERFVVLSGEARIEIRRLFDDVIQTFEVTGERPVAVDMPTLHTHNITNVGQGELLTAFWANDHFDPAQPDTFAELVRPLARAR
jgi:UDP-2-acetamido-2,6-beta-L-arabino-hexul-4-ose reductase